MILAKWLRCAVLVGLVSVAVSSSFGCSFLFLETLPSAWDNRDTHNCSTSSLWPVLDILQGGSEAILAGAALDAERPNGILITSSIVGALVYGASAIYGMGETERCDEARHDQTRQQVYSFSQPRRRKKLVSRERIGKLKVVKSKGEEAGQEIITLSYRASAEHVLNIQAHLHEDVAAERLIVALVSDSSGQPLLRHIAEVTLILNNKTLVPIQTTWRDEGRDSMHELASGTISIKKLAYAMRGLSSLEIRAGSLHFALTAKSVARFSEFVSYVTERLPGEANAALSAAEKGELGGLCYGNKTCNEDLECSAGDRCMKQPALAGELGGACYGNRTCNAELECAENGLCGKHPSQPGELGARCYGNGTCNEGLTCSSSSDLCS